MARLILIEGIPGSGKTTLAALLAAELKKAMPTTYYLEDAAEHPTDLTWHACFLPTEFGALLSAFPADAPALHAQAIEAGGYVLVRYRKGEAFLFAGALLDALRAKELRWRESPAIPFEAYRAVHIARFARLAAAARDARGAIILESAFLQRPVQDMLLHYNLTDDVILETLAACARAAAPLSPALFYLTQQEPEKTLARVAAERAMPEMAYPDAIEFWRKRRALELSCLPRLPLAAHALDNTARDASRTVAEMLRLLR